MDESLFWIVVCSKCKEIYVIDQLKDQVECSFCGSDDVRVKSVVPDDFKDFMISTKVVLWQFFARKARG